MRLGITLPQCGPLAGPDSIRAVATRAESLGYDSLWVLDRLLYPASPRAPYPATADGSLPDAYRRVLDPVSVLTFAAACTSRASLGTSVLNLPWYNPSLLARQLTTLDLLSGGRLRAGFGTGWSPDEYEAVGVDMKQRGARANEALALLKQLWADPTAPHDGAHFKLPATHSELRPVQAPPKVYMAAYTPATMKRVAEHTDGWMPAGVPVPAMKQMWDGIRGMAQAAGREPSTLELIVRANLVLTQAPLGDDRGVFTGSVDQVRADVAATRELGAHELFFELGFTEEGSTLEGQLALLERLRALLAPAEAARRACCRVSCPRAGGGGARRACANTARTPAFGVGCGSMRASSARLALACTIVLAACSSEDDAPTSRPTGPAYSEPSSPRAGAAGARAAGGASSSSGGSVGGDTPLPEGIVCGVDGCHPATGAGGASQAGAAGAGGGVGPAGATSGGSGGSMPGGSAGTLQGGSAGTLQGGFGGTLQAGSAGSLQGGFAGTAQAGFAGAPQGGSGGTSPFPPPIAYWPLDVVWGVAAAEQTPVFGAMLNGVTSVPGLSLGAMHPAAVNSYMWLPATTWDQPLSEFSVSVWVRPDDDWSALAGHEILRRGGTLLSRYSNAVSFSVGSDVAKVTLPIEAGHWYHVVGVYSAGVEISVSVEDAGAPGPATQAKPATTGAVDSTGPVTIFNVPSGAFHGGAVDDLALFAKALTAGERAELYTRGLLGDSPSCPQCATPLAPMHVWRFDEATYERETQELIQGLTSATVGDTDSAIGLVGGASHAPEVLASFNSYQPGSGIEVAPHSSLQGTTMTLSAWVRPDRTLTASDVGMAWFDSDASLPNRGYWFGYDKGVTLTLGDGLTANRPRHTQALPLSGGVWHHVVATYDGVTSKIYVDGALAGQQSLGFTYAPNPAPLRLCGNAEAAIGLPVFPGACDEVAVFGDALDAGQVSQLHDRGLAGQPLL